MATYILRLDEGHCGPSVAIKDLIDWRGTPTSAGSPAAARRAVPAAADAVCLAGLRAALDAGAARVTGKANLHELASGATGINLWFGTPVNPLDAGRIPGGSSSGSAVAVASGDADLAIGTDTGGSVRIPSACCGTAGLKTTHGRIPLDGVWPLAPSLDTIGPMARDVAGVVAAMALLEPGFAPAPVAPRAVARYRPPADPMIDAAVDAALAAAGLTVTDVDLPGWRAAGDATLVVIAAEAWDADRHLLDDPDGLGPSALALLRDGPAMSARAPAAHRRLADWRAELLGVFDRHPLIALPTLVVRPPELDGRDNDGRLLLATMPVNGAGVPALSLPVPTAAGWPASLQLLGRPGSEEVLVALGARVEAALAP